MRHTLQLFGALFLVATVQAATPLYDQAGRAVAQPHGDSPCYRDAPR